ncbi:hypothetical protein ABKN59_007286 [Abortiporus biennis]
MMFVYITLYHMLFFWLPICNISSIPPNSDRCIPVSFLAVFFKKPRQPSEENTTNLTNSKLPGQVPDSLVETHPKVKNVVHFVQIYFRPGLKPSEYHRIDISLSKLPKVSINRSLLYLLSLSNK